MNSYYGKFSPVVRDGIPDYKVGSVQWQNWIEEQEHYILNGYQAGGDKITGRMYFKLNFTTMRVLGADNYHIESSPYYVDVQREFYDQLDWCFETGTNIIVGKGRDKGFSYDSVSEALYETHFHDNTSILALFPGGKSPAKKEWREKYDMAWNTLINDFKYYPMNGGSQNELYYAWEEKDEVTGQSSIQGSKSKLTMLEAVDADIGKSGRPKVIIMEEFGEIKKPLSLIVTSRANMQAGAKKFGIIIAGGTSNAFKETGYEDFRELWYNPAAYNFVKFFIPAQRAYWGFVDYNTGKSDEAGALEDILKRRKDLKGDELMIEMQNYPTSEKEMFISIKGSPYDAFKCADQTDRILTDATIKNAVETGNLFMGKDERGEPKVEFRITPNGRWKIFKHHSANLMTPDVGGVDGYRLANVEQSDSKGAIVVYRGFQGVNKIGNLPICIYHNRPEDKDDFFHDCWMTAVYYNIKLLVEYTDEDIIKYFTERRALKYLKERPRLVQSPYSKATYSYGIKPTDYNKGAATEYAVKEFNHHYEQIVFVELLDELSNFGIRNTDIADAYQWAVLHAMDNIKVLPGYEKKKVKPFMPYMAVNGAGEMVVVNTPQKSELYMRSAGYGEKRYIRQ